MGDKFVFHIRNAPPEDLLAVLHTLDVVPGLSSTAEVVEQAKALGFAVRDQQRLEALTTARDLGLVQRRGNALTRKGKTLVHLESSKPDLFVDLVHGLLYALWDPGRRSENCFSWSYRALCQILWQGGDAKVVSRRELASEVEMLAKDAFERSKIAFSPKSVGGALLWLAQLVPPVLNATGELFSPRSFCPPELFVLAVDFTYRYHEIDYGANLLLSEEHREDICQMCLLTPYRFDRVLDYAVIQFDYLHKGIGGGWGQYLLLDRAPKVEDFV